MAKLEALLEQRGVVTPREVSEAVARCQLHGGDLTTSLLQFVSADEAALSAVLSECYGLQAAPVGLLPAPDDAASRSLPREVAERYCCFPLEAGPGRLVLGVARPFDEALKEELGLTLGVTIEERVALEVRIRQALSRFYGLPMSARNARGIARLEGDLEAAGQETPLGLWSDTQLSTRPPSGEPLSPRDSQRPPSVRPRSHSETPRFGAVSAPPVSMERQARRRGPLSLASAREELGRAATRNEALDIFFAFASQSFEYSALFAVHSALAEGLDAWGKGASRETVLGIGVPLDLPSSLSEAAETCKVRLTRLGKEGIDRTLMADLQRQHNNKVLVLPVSLRGRCAVLLYADNGEADVLEREIADVVALAPDIANALGRIILQRKKDAARLKSVDPGDGESPLPPRRSQPAHESAGSRSASSPAAPEVRDAEARKSGRATGSRPDATAALLQSGADSSPHPMVALGPSGKPSNRARKSSPTPAPGARAATPLPPSADDPVFLLARPHTKSAPASAPSPSVAKPSVSITHPARLVASRPRLPSVIVDPESADPEASERATRAAAVTRAPTQARSDSFSAGRRPAVPPPADAPRALGSAREEGARSAASAATTIPAGRSRVLEEEAANQRSSGVVSLDAAAFGSESEEENFEPSANAWPPPIMDHSPPPRQAPLTALVPIIIADPPKGRRGYGAVRGNAPRGPQRPASNPAGPASPTLPSAARVRRAEPVPVVGTKPAATAVHGVARAEPSSVPPLARESGAVAGAPSTVVASLSDAVVATTAAAPPPVLRIAPAAAASGGGNTSEPVKTRPHSSSANAPTLPAPARGASGPSNVASTALPAAPSPGPALPTVRPGAALEHTVERGSRPPLALQAAGMRSAPAVVSPARLPSLEPLTEKTAPGAKEVAAAPARSPVSTAAASASSSASSASPASAPSSSASASSASPASAPSSSAAASSAPRFAFAPPGSPSIPNAAGSLPAQVASSTRVSAATAVNEPSVRVSSASAVTIPARPLAVGVSISPSVTITVAGPSPKPGGAVSAVVEKPASAPSNPVPSGPPASGTITARPRAAEASTTPERAPPSTPQVAEGSVTPVANAPSPASSGPPPGIVSGPGGDRLGAERPAIFPPAPPDAAIEELVENVCQGKLDAVHELARIGAHGLHQVMARFPGPVISERAGPSSRASECGPLLQALAAIGSPAMPSITQSSVHEDARVRRWATLLLGEMPGPEACRAVVQRLADDVPRVHQAALDAARLLLASPAADLFRSTLFEVAEAEEAPLTLRLRTLEHVAKLKDSASVPRLIAFLGADLEPIVHKALWALTVVTRHDYGRDARAWAEFWQKNAGRHRLEWLIEALDEHDPRLRKAAAEELREEAGDLYGYTEDLPAPERHAAQEKLRKWWSSSGAARHARAGSTP